MNWQASNLEKEFQRFAMHCEFMFAGPLNSKTEKEKIGYLMTYIGDKGRDAYCTFNWVPGTPAVAANNDHAAVPATPAENETLTGVVNKFKAFCAPQKNRIRATVTYNRRKQEPGERFDDFVTALRILVKDCDYQEPDRMLRDGIVLRAKHDAVREKCLDEGDGLPRRSAHRQNMIDDDLNIVKTCSLNMVDDVLAMCRTCLMMFETCSVYGTLVRT